MLDMKAQRKDLYAPAARDPVIVEVPAMQFLMIDGTGDPNSAPAYREAVEALYALSYALKFKYKRGPAALDYAVMPLEGLWTLPDGREPDGQPLTPERKATFTWTMLIRQPDDATDAIVEELRQQVARKKALPALPALRLETFEEGRAAQIMHLGPYDDEAPTIARLHAFIETEGYTLRGKHHEIYLNDPRRTAPEKLRTVLRQPIA
jgi:hypothetical protein